MSMENQEVGLAFTGTPVSEQEVYDSNDKLQQLKPENERQYSFEKLNIGENWYAVELTADDILNMQCFVETSGLVTDSYKFWKEHGVVTLGDIVAIASDAEKENYWTIKPNANMPEKYPAILIFIADANGNRLLGKGALLNMGNILDGNHRLAREAEKILKMTDEERANYRLPAYVANISPMLAARFNLYYMVEPIINSMRKVCGKTVADIDPLNVMNIPDKLRLLSQRLGN